MTSQYLQQLNATTIGSGSYLIPISDPGSGRLLKITKDNLFNGLYVQSSGYLNMNAHSLTLSNDMTFNQALTTTSSPIFNNLIASGVVNLCSITNSGIIDIRPGYNSDINVFMSGASSYVHFHSVSGGGLNFDRINMNDQGNRFVYYSNGSLRWTFGQLGDGTDNYILYNNTVGQNAWSANYTTNVVDISQLTVSGNALSVSAATSLNQNLRYSDSPTFNNLTLSGNAFVNGTISVLGTFNASGNMVFGDTSADTITQNASSRTLNNTETITRTATASTESIQVWKVSDDANASLTLANGTSNSGEFAPKFQGINGSNNVALNFNGQGTLDTGTNPVILFLSQIGNTNVTTRKAVSFWNLVTPIMELTGGYNMQLSGPSTTPTIATAVADTVSLAAVDKAAFDRRLYIQPESGAWMSIGNDRFNFSAATGYLSIGSTDTITLTSTASSFSTSIVSTGTGGIGYATGAGGAVTQTTSRTTGVTLNKIAGSITLVSAAGTTAWNTFTVTNSTVAATDVPRVSQKSGTDKYQIHVTAVAAGSFAITYATTGGTTTEQPVFNFVVIKGVAA
jgi:hypothetical protein